MKLGGKFRYGIELNLLLENGNISLDSIGINPKYIVNAAGAQADKIAKQIGLAKEYAMIPFIGVYLTDLTMIESGNPDFVKDHPHLINFHKRQLIHFYYMVYR